MLVLGRWGSSFGDSVLVLFVLRLAGLELTSRSRRGLCLLFGGRRLAVRRRGFLKCMGLSDSLVAPRLLLDISIEDFGLTKQQGDVVSYNRSCLVYRHLRGDISICSLALLALLQLWWMSKCMLLRGLQC